MFHFCLDSVNGQHFLCEFLCVCAIQRSGRPHSQHNILQSRSGLGDKGTLVKFRERLIYLNVNTSCLNL